MSRKKTKRRRKGKGRPAMFPGEQMRNIRASVPDSVFRLVEDAAEADGAMYDGFPSPGIWVRRVIFKELKRRKLLVL